MQTVATFFTGVMLFFSGLFGATPHQVVSIPSVTGSTSVQVIKTSTATPISISQTSSVSGSKEVTLLTFKSPFAEPRDSNVILLSAGPVATIQQDFGGYVVYTSKDSSKIYFVICKETQNGCNLALLNYLDIKEKRYHNTKYEYSSNDPITEGTLLVQTTDFKEVRTLDLETGIEKIVYTKKNNLESLISGCFWNSGGQDNEWLEHSSDIENLNNKHVRVGIYKAVGQDSLSCEKETKYKKIRDDIVDLNKF
jgi:hypothetical protein